MTGAVHTIPTNEASIVCADGHVAYTKCTCTTLSFLLDHFLGLLDGLPCCHYGGHLAALVLVLVAVWGLSNDDNEVAKGPVLQLDQACNSIGNFISVSMYAPVLVLQSTR
jgi:hypothetical protein